MSLPERRTITKESPLTVREIRNFASQIEVGDSVPTIVVAAKHWTSTTKYEEIHKAASAKIVKKYRDVVKTNYGVMTWSDLIFGYYAGIIPAMLDKKSSDKIVKAA